MVLLVAALMMVMTAVPAFALPLQRAKGQLIADSAQESGGGGRGVQPAFLWTAAYVEVA